MVEYNCNKCNMKFNKKSNYLKHVSKKYSCGVNSDIQEDLIEHSKKIQNIPKKSKNLFEASKNNNLVENSTIEDNKVYFCCNFCSTPLHI